MEVILVYVTCTDQQEASTIAQRLVEGGLAACANIFPAVNSIYKFEGEVQYGQEIVLILKTIEENYLSLEAEIKKFHSYQVPCVVKVPITGGEPGFLKWVEESCAGKAE